MPSGEASRITPFVIPELGNQLKDYPIGRVAQEITKAVQENLRILESPFGVGPRPRVPVNQRSDGTTYTVPMRRTFGQGGMEEVQGYTERDTVGGSHCDTCGKSRQELQEATLHLCARCKMAYYCSPACQEKAWRGGHKKACRKEGEIKAEDVMRLDGLVNKPELNGMLVKVMGKDSSSERWKIQLMDSRGTMISVKAANLHRLRPAA